MKKPSPSPSDRITSRCSHRDKIARVTSHHSNTHSSHYSSTHLLRLVKHTLDNISSIIEEPGSRTSGHAEYRSDPGTWTAVPVMAG